MRAATRNPVGMVVRRIVPDFQAADPAANGAFFTEVLGLEVAMDLGWIVTWSHQAIRRRRSA